MNSFQLFLSQVQTAPEVLKIRVLHIVFDILMVHDRDFLGPNSANVSFRSPVSMYFAEFTSYQGDRIIEFLLHILDSEASDKVQALICIGMSKLMLSGMVSDERVCSVFISHHATSI